MICVPWLPVLAWSPYGKWPQSPAAKFMKNLFPLHQSIQCATGELQINSAAEKKTIFVPKVFSVSQLSNRWLILPLFTLTKAALGFEEDLFSKAALDQLVPELEIRQNSGSKRPANTN